jgi:hypothetical protein
MSRSQGRKGSRGDRKRAGFKYEVGYGRPPVATRFRRGGVGNPKGRPKKKKTVGQMIEAALMIPVTVEEKGRPKRITALEIIFRTLVHAAARGDNGAIRTLFALEHRYKDSPETTVNLEETSKEDREIIEQFRAKLPATGSDGILGASTGETDQNRDKSKADGLPTGGPDSSEGHQS